MDNRTRGVQRDQRFLILNTRLLSFGLDGVSSDSDDVSGEAVPRRPNSRDVIEARKRSSSFGRFLPTRPWRSSARGRSSLSMLAFDRDL